MNSTTRKLLWSLLSDYVKERKAVFTTAAEMYGDLHPITAAHREQLKDARDAICDFSDYCASKEAA